MFNTEEQQLMDYFDNADFTFPETLEAFIQFGQNVFARDYGNRSAVLKKSEKTKIEYMSLMVKRPDEARMFYEMYWQLVLFEAKNRQLDSYLLYLEKDRIPNERFYLPKRDCFLRIGLIQALQQMLDDELDGLAISLPPGTGKTTLSKFFISGVIGWFPKDFNLFYSHSADITRMYYDGALDIITNTQEYKWHDVFPNLEVTAQNAKMQQFNVGKYKPFYSLNTASVGSSMAGKVRCSKHGYLMVDDMISKIDEALNKAILDKLWNNYAVDALQRKLDGAKEIHIATRWSVHDVIGRLQRLHEGDPRWKFIAVPDIDEKTGKSNFDYEYDGFSVKFFEKQAETMDEISYRCLYKNQPIEREGLLYVEEQLRRFTTLPGVEPDAIWGICDTKSKGTDFMFLPCAYQYGDDFYIVDCVCDDSSDFNYQYERLADFILKYNLQQCEFESNAGGDRIAYEVSKIVQERGGRCNITTKPTETNKETRIFVNSAWVIQHCLFRMKEDYERKSDYAVMMMWLLCYSVAGRNIHDDVPDGFANLALFVQARNNVKPVFFARSPFDRR